MKLLLAAVLLAQSFSGLSLEQAQSAAVQRSPDVAIAQSKVDEEQAAFDAARATYGPAFLASYAEAPQGGNANETIAQRLTTVGAQVTLGDLVSYSPLVAEANAALLAAKFDFADAERTERLNVVDLYFSALTAETTLDARKASLAGAQGDLRAARLRFRSGDVPRLDVVRASVALAQSQADLDRAQADADNAIAALATETGTSANGMRVAEVPSSLGVAVTTSVDAAVATALEHRPEIASARASVAAEEHAVAVAERGGLPAVTVSGGYTSGVDTGIKVAGPSLNVNATLPVGGAASDRIRAERARLAQARARLAKAQRAIATEVGAAIRVYEAQTSALTAAERALSEARAALKATEIGYRSGASSSLDIQTARTTYVQALISEISARYGQAKAEATVSLLIGTSHA